MQVASVIGAVKDSHGISTNHRVYRNDCKAFTLRLGHQHPIERVAMVQRQSGSFNGMVEMDRKG